MSNNIAEADEEIFIESRFEHSHTLSELDTIKIRGVKQEIKQLVAPMIANKVKPGKIDKILKNYASKGIIKENDLPSVTQIADLKRNERRKETFIRTDGEFQESIQKLDPD